MEAERSEPPRKRRRPPKSCEQCRKRKVRCDQNSPCNQCIHMKIDDCTYDPQTLIKRNEQRSKPPTTKAVSQGAPPTPASTIEYEPESRYKDSSIHTAAIGLAQSPASTVLIDKIATAKRKNHPFELLDDRPLIESLHNTRQGFDHSSSIGTDLHGTVTKTRLLGRSHWINMGQELGFILKLQRKVEAGEHQDAKLMLDKCKTLGRKIKSQTLSQVKIFPNILEYLPTKAVADELVDKYFRAFETCYRILHIPSFRQEYEQFWSATESANPVFLIKLLLVLAIGSCLSDDQNGNQLHISAMQWINAAQSWLSSPFTEKARLSLSGIQVHCLLLLAREVNSISSDLIWISAGSLMRMAILIGLHRDPSHFQRLTPFQSEMRRRMWATVTEICLQSAMNAGGAPMISAETYDCQAPFNYNDDDLDEETGLVAAVKDETVFTQTSFQIALMQTLPQRCRIATMLNDFRVKQTYCETIQIGSTLSESLNQLSTRLKSSIGNPAPPQHDTALRMYEIMTCRFLLNIHQSFAIRALTDPMFYFSRKVCLDTCLHIALATFPQLSGVTQTTEFQKIIGNHRGTFQSVILLVFILIGVELTAQLEASQSGPSSITDQLLQQEMFRVLDAFADLNLRRVKMQETNVKGFVFSNCGNAMLRAKAAGIPDEPAGIEAVMKALEISVDLLEKRLDRLCGPNISSTSNVNDQLGGDFNMPFGDDLGWDDWDPTFSLDGYDLFIP